MTFLGVPPVEQAVEEAVFAGVLAVAVVAEAVVVAAPDGEEDRESHHRNRVRSPGIQKPPSKHSEDHPPSAPQEAMLQGIESHMVSNHQDAS